jgi:type II secretory pathway pseudopilin PulG
MVAAANMATTRSDSDRRAGCGGFTYVGVLFLIVIMGIALAVAGEVWQNAQRREKEQELLFVGDQFRRALALYQANGGGYPARLEDLLKDPRIPGVRRYLRRIYRDPITGRTEWGLVKSGEAITGVYSLSGQEPLKKAQFSLVDQDFEGKQKYSEWVFSPKPAQGAAAPGTRPVAAPGTRPAAGTTPSRSSR